MLPLGHITENFKININKKTQLYFNYIMSLIFISPNFSGFVTQFHILLLIKMWPYPLLFGHNRQIVGELPGLV